VVDRKYRGYPALGEGVGLGDVIDYNIGSLNPSVAAGQEVLKLRSRTASGETGVHRACGSTG
jgi:hypothetical protein